MRSSIKEMKLKKTSSFAGSFGKKRKDAQNLLSKKFALEWDRNDLREIVGSTNSKARPRSSPSRCDRTNQRNKQLSRRSAPHDENRSETKMRSETPVEGTQVLF